MERARWNVWHDIPDIIACINGHFFGFEVKMEIGKPTKLQEARTVFGAAPTGGTRNVHRMEDVIIKIVDMESEINADIDRLVDLKKEIAGVIHRVSNLEYQTLLELRYLCASRLGSR